MLASTTSQSGCIRHVRRRQAERHSLQTEYFPDLTENVYNNPVSHVVSPRDVVGIDDIMVA